jgi:hypothetical protein
MRKTLIAALLLLAACDKSSPVVQVDSSEAPAVDVPANLTPTDAPAAVSPASVPSDTTVAS